MSPCSIRLGPFDQQPDHTIGKYGTKDVGNPRRFQDTYTKQRQWALEGHTKPPQEDQARRDNDLHPCPVVSRHKLPGGGGRWWAVKPHAFMARFHADLIES